MGGVDDSPWLRRHATRQRVHQATHTANTAKHTERGETDNVGIHAVRTSGDAADRVVTVGVSQSSIGLLRFAIFFISSNHPQRFDFGRVLYDKDSTELPGFKTQRELQGQCVILNMLLLGKTQTCRPARYHSPPEKGTKHDGYNSRSVPDDGQGNSFYILGQQSDKQAFPAFVLYFEHYKGYSTTRPPWCWRC